jgi:hypothetical protein
MSRLDNLGGQAPVSGIDRLLATLVIALVAAADAGAPACSVRDAQPVLTVMSSSTSRWQTTSKPQRSRMGRDIAPA